MIPQHDQPNQQTGSRMINRVDGDVTGSVLQARSIRGNVYLLPSSVPPPGPPRLLPPVPAHFTGREAELVRLSTSTRRASASIRLVLITGAAGAGKTALALAWLHGGREQYPDGQLFADLQGYASNRPASSQHVLGQFLRILGVSPSALPDTVEERSALFRSLTTDRRMVVLLDNSASMADVLPFVPGPPHSMLVVTTRRRMPGLVALGAETVALPPLPDDATLALITRIAGADRVLADQKSAGSLVRLCGGLPLAICLAAAQLATRPRRSIRELVGDMEVDGRRLVTLAADGPMSVRAALDLSYHSLPAPAAQVFRLVCAHPGPDFSVPVAAAAAGISPTAVRLLLEQLADVHLIEELQDEQYRFHDLVRDYARDQAATADADRSRADSWRRMGTWYLVTARVADRAVMPTRRRLTHPELNDSTAPRFDTAVLALDWTEAHLTHFLDLVRNNPHGHHDPYTYALVDALWSLFIHRKHYPEWLQTHGIALCAARADGNFLAETLLLNHLGLGLLDLHRFDEAQNCFARALDLHHAAGDKVGEASTLNSLGLVFDGLERFCEAEDYFGRALTMQVELGERRGAALTRVNLARTHIVLEKAEEASSHLGLARAVFQELADEYNAARTTIEMAVLELTRDASNAAETLLHEAMRTMTFLGADHELARIRDLLARSARLRGDDVAERDHHRAAQWHRQQIGGPVEEHAHKPSQ